MTIRHRCSFLTQNDAQEMGSSLNIDEEILLAIYSSHRAYDVGHGTSPQCSTVGFKVVHFPIGATDVKYQVDHFLN